MLKATGPADSKWFWPKFHAKQRICGVWVCNIKLEAMPGSIFQVVVNKFNRNFMFLWNRKSFCMRKWNVLKSVKLKNVGIGIASMICKLYTNNNKSINDMSAHGFLWMLFFNSELNKAIGLKTVYVILIHLKSF